MKLNKKFVPVLLMALTLTACNNMPGNTNNEEAAPNSTELAESVEKVEGKDANEASSEEAKEQASTESSTEDQAEEASSQADTTSSEEATSDEVQNSQSDKEALEQAIFDNRVQARAAEILLEESPATIEAIASDLEELVSESQTLVEEGRTLLDSLEN